MTLPTGLQSLTFEGHFNQRRDNMTVATGLQSLTFEGHFNQRLDNMTVATGLQSLTFEGHFNQRLDNMTVATGLQSLTFEGHFNQRLDNMTVATGLQSLTVQHNNPPMKFCCDFNCRLICSSLRPRRHHLQQHCRGCLGLPQASASHILEYRYAIKHHLVYLVFPHCCHAGKL